MAGEPKRGNTHHAAFRTHHAAFRMHHAAIRTHHPVEPTVSRLLLPHHQGKRETGRAAWATPPSRVIAVHATSGATTGGHVQVVAG